MRTLKIFLVAALVAAVVRLLPFIFLECQSEHGDFSDVLVKGRGGRAQALDGVAGGLQSASKSGRSMVFR